MRSEEKLPKKGIFSFIFLHFSSSSLVGLKKLKGVDKDGRKGQKKLFLTLHTLHTLHACTIGLMFKLAFRAKGETTRTMAFLRADGGVITTIL